MIAAFSVDDGIELAETPAPQPGPDEALIRVRAVGICETDVHITLHSAPGEGDRRIMGHEWSGTVESVPEGFDLREGERVVGEGMVGCGRCPMCLKGRTNLCRSYREIGFSLPGAYAQHLVVPARNLHRLPRKLSFEDGALVEPTAVAFHALQLSGMSPGESVAILGPGPIGLLTVQIAKARGAQEVMLTGTREDRLSLGARLGADTTVNIAEEDPVQVLGSRGSGGPDVVVDAAGTRSSFLQAVSMVAKGGRVVLIGAWEEVTWRPGVLIGKEIRLLGSLASPGAWGPSLELLSSRRVRVAPLITHRFPLSRIAEAFRLVDGRERGLVKAVLFP